MSDYIPQPETEMHINQMPEECLRTLFTQLPFETQFKAGNVCRLWCTVRDGLFLTRKSLAVVIDNHMNQQNASGDLIITGFNEERSATLVAMFPSLSQLTIYTSNETLFEEPAPVAHLLTQYRHQLHTLKLKSEPSSQWEQGTRTGDLLFEAINAMTALKQLTLHFDLGVFGSLAPFDLPILRQLDKLHFDCSQMWQSTITQWAPHLEARLTPMEISFPATWMNTYSPDDSDFYESLTPKVASMFTHLPLFPCSLQQFQRLATRFTNLTVLELDDDFEGDHLPYSSSVPALMHSLANLKHLTTLSIFTRYASQVDGQPVGVDDRLSPQLPTIKKWHLSLNAERTYSHSHLFPWTTNLGWYFPNLEYLSIVLNGYTHCVDCAFNSLVEFGNGQSIDYDEKRKVVRAQAKDCLRHQLRLIKQQQSCPQLKTAVMQYNMPMGTMFGVGVVCTLEDLAD